MGEEDKIAQKMAIDGLCFKRDKHKNASPFLFAGLVAAFFYAAVVSYFLSSGGEYALPKCLCCFGVLTVIFYPLLFLLFPYTKKEAEQ